MRIDIPTFLKKAISVIYGFFTLIALFLCMFFSNIGYGRSINLPYFCPILLLFFLGLLLISLLILVGGKIAVISNKKWNLITFIVFILLFLLQLFAVDKYYFYTDWDAYNVNVLSDYIVIGKAVVPEQNYYISMYPNNQFFVLLQVIIKYPFYSLGLYELGYFAMLFIQCVINSLTGFLVVKVADKLINNKTVSFVVMCLYILLIGISPWVSIPYTDSFGLLFPVLILFTYISKGRFKKSFVFWGIISFITVVGYHIKPQICFVTIAIVTIELIEILKDGFIKKYIFSILSFVMCFALGYLIINGLVNTLPLNINKGDSFSAAHYLMMGLNEEDMGVWSMDDVAFSNSFTDYKERQEGNLSIAKKRLDSMGILGLSKLYARKTLSNFNDGTFGWSGEGLFFYILREDNNSPISDFFKDIYYMQDKAPLKNVGSYYAFWVNLEQLVWLSVFSISMISALNWDDKNKNVVTVALIGLILFQTIFEARARYLYIYAPYYLLLAAYSLRIVLVYAKKQKRNINKQ